MGLVVFFFPRWDHARIAGFGKIDCVAKTEAFIGGWGPELAGTTS